MLQTLFISLAAFTQGLLDQVDNLKTLPRHATTIMTEIEHIRQQMNPILQKSAPTLSDEDNNILASHLQRLKGIDAITKTLPQDDFKVEGAIEVIADLRRKTYVIRLMSEVNKVLQPEHLTPDDIQLLTQAKKSLKEKEKSIADTTIQRRMSALAQKIGERLAQQT